MPPTRGQTKRPREALLQLGIGLKISMFSVGGSAIAIWCADETPPLGIFNSNHP